MDTNQLWIVYVLVFGAALLAVQGVYLLAVRARQDKKAINRRLDLGTQLGSPTEVLEALRRERGLAGDNHAAVFRALHELVVQTGLRISRTRLLVWLLGLTALWFLIFSMAFGMGLMGLALAVAMALLTLYGLLNYLRRKRIALFGEQLPDAVDVLVRGLRAGHPLRIALALVAREMPDPIGSEFGILADEISFGLDVDTAVHNLCTRVGHEDLSFFEVAINIQNQTGGNLAEILGRLSQLVRNRSKMFLKIRALTSEGRLSAIILSLTPFILFLIINLLSPSYFGGIWDHPVALPAAVVGLFLVGAGNLIMYRMVNFKF